MATREKFLGCLHPVAQGRREIWMIKIQFCSTSRELRMLQEDWAEKQYEAIASSESREALFKLLSELKERMTKKKEQDKALHSWQAFLTQQLESAHRQSTFNLR